MDTMLRTVGFIKIWLTFIPGGEWSDLTCAVERRSWGKYINKTAGLDWRQGLTWLSFVYEMGRVWTRKNHCVGDNGSYCMVKKTVWLIYHTNWVLVVEGCRNEMLSHYEVRIEEQLFYNTGISKWIQRQMKTEEKCKQSHRYNKRWDQMSSKGSAVQ